MKEVKIIFGQTVLDIAVQELGDASRAMELAILNGISLTDELSADQVLVVPVAAKDKRSTVQLFSNINKSQAPASADVSGQMMSKDDGIEFWAIEKDFEVQ
jgi:hypothetical protein